MKDIVDIINETENKEKTANEQAVIEEEKAEEIVEIEITKKSETKEEVKDVKPKNPDKFNLAKVLGKTESGMKAEFYVYQIKELMQKVGKIFDTKRVSVADISDCYASLQKFGASELLVSPIYASECAKVEKRGGDASVSFGAIIDYPFGESSFKAKLTELKNCLKCQFNSVTVTFPTSAVYLGKTNAEKNNVVKLAKKCKVPFGVALDSEIPMDDMRKLLKAFANSKISYVTLLLDKMDRISMLDYFEEVAAYKGKLKVYVYSSVNNLKDLSTLIELSADKVYTPFVEEIGQELLDKFDVEI